MCRLFLLAVVLIWLEAIAGPALAHEFWLTREFRNFCAYPRIHKAFDYYRKGEYHKAGKLFEAAVKIDPNNTEAHKALAETCLKLNDLACAKRQGKTLNRLAPQSPAGYIILARIADLEKRPMEAVNAAEAALRLVGMSPNQRAQLVELLTDNLIKEGNLDQAMAELLKIKKTKKNKKQLKTAYDKIIDLCIIKNEIRKGLKWYGEYVKQFGPADEHTRLYWSNLLVEHGDVQNAYAIIASLPSRGPVLSHKVNLLEKLGQYRKAADLLSKNSCQAEKQNAQYWISAATLYRKAGDVDGELKTLNMGIQSVKDNTRLYTMAIDRLIHLKAYSKAIRLLKEEIKKHDSEALHLQLMELYEKENIPLKEKIEHFEAAYPFLHLPDNYRFEFIMGLIHLERMAHNEDRAKNMVRDLTRWKTLSPKRLEHLATLSSALGMCKEAISLAQRLIAQSPQSAHARLIAGYCYQKEGESKQAITFLKEAARLTPNIATPKFLTGLGDLYAEIGDKQQALTQWGAALNQKFDPDVALKMARLYHEEKEEKKADELLSKINPDHFDRKKRADYWAFKGLVAERLGDLKPAAAAYRKSLSEWETAQTWAQLGYNRIARGEKPAAVQAFQEALILAPDDGAYRASLAYLLSETGKPGEAAVAFREAIRSKPHDISLYEGLGYAEIRVNNYSAATDAFKHVIDYYADQSTPEDPKTVEKVYRIKQTLDNINQRLHVDFAEVIRLDNSPFGPQPNIVANSSYSGFGVLLADYKAVHSLGPLNSDVSVYGRFLWANKNQSLSVEKELSQAGLGVSVKPLGDYDFHLSLERMFKVGSDTQNDLMVRSGVSFAEGGYWHPTKEAWGYYDLYLDGAYLIDSAQLYLTSNLRWGRAYKLWDACALVPYLTGGAVDSNGNTWIDAGVGITLAIWGFESRYHAHRLLTRITLEGRQHLAGSSEDEHTVRLKYEMAF